jgi:hypothetical protein
MRERELMLEYLSKKRNFGDQYRKNDGGVVGLHRYSRCTSSRSESSTDFLQMTVLTVHT